mmetsp:Transcript_83220/g.235714  ORF Transcript_83220/g.235714 Transcript_83220/m.235714 type:complete len:240 (+) Transcript_83220:218-937(+)
MCMVAEKPLQPLLVPQLQQDMYDRSSMAPTSLIGLSSLHSSNDDMASVNSAPSLVLFRASGVLGKLMPPGLPPVSSPLSPALSLPGRSADAVEVDPAPSPSSLVAGFEVSSSSPSAAAAAGPGAPRSPASPKADSLCRNELTTLSNSSWSRVSIRSWPSFAAQRAHPVLPFPGPSSTVTSAHGHRPRVTHWLVCTSATWTMHPAATLHNSLLLSSGWSLRAIFSRTRYLPPTCQGQSEL